MKYECLQLRSMRWSWKVDWYTRTKCMRAIKKANKNGMNEWRDSFLRCFLWAVGVRWPLNFVVSKNYGIASMRLHFLVMCSVFVQLVKFIVMENLHAYGHPSSESPSRWCAFGSQTLCHQTLADNSYVNVQLIIMPVIYLCPFRYCW